jgi:hypothetical protein
MRFSTIAASWLKRADDTRLPLLMSVLGNADAAVLFTLDEWRYRREVWLKRSAHRSNFTGGIGAALQLRYVRNDGCEGDNHVAPMRIGRVKQI